MFQDVNDTFATRQLVTVVTFPAWKEKSVNP